MMRLKATIINLMVFPIIHQFLKIFYLIAVLFGVLAKPSKHNNEEVQTFGELQNKKIPGNFLRFLANALFNGDLFSSSQDIEACLRKPSQIIDFEMMFVRPFKPFFKAFKKPRIEQSNISKMQAKRALFIIKIFGAKIKIFFFLKFK